MLSDFADIQKMKMNTFADGAHISNQHCFVDNNTNFSDTRLGFYRTVINKKFWKSYIIAAVFGGNVKNFSIFLIKFKLVICHPKFYL